MLTNNVGLFAPIALANYWETVQRTEPPVTFMELPNGVLIAWTAPIERPVNDLDD